MNLSSLVSKAQNFWRITKLTRKVAAKAPVQSGTAPVVFFNASTRLTGISQNAAFAMLTSMGVQMAGTPVVHFGCRAGMSRCVLGAVVAENPTDPPPCKACTARSEILFANAPTEWFTYEEDAELFALVNERTTPELETLTHKGIPLGALTLPSLRWTLRRHHLQDDEPTRFLFRQFILSAYRIVTEFSALLDKVKPQAVVVFNGIAYPEASARWAAEQRGIRTITHEVAHQPMTAFFSHGEVTAYPVDIPDDFQLTDAQNAQLNAYLTKRFKGDFTMAGVQFWPEMKGLEGALAEKIAHFQQMVPVFTNVIFDTSQMHANTLFPHMFAWLDQVKEIAEAHPDTLFVIRAHPDETRPGKASVETVAAWVVDSGTGTLPNVVFIPPNEFVSSYALIEQAKFSMVYNSTIGLEAALMGKPVLNGGKARYTQVECVFLPANAEEHRTKANELLAAETILVPPKYIDNARYFQYYQLYRTPIPFDSFLEDHETRGYVRLKKFPYFRLSPVSSKPIQVVVDGILGEGEFIMPDNR